MENINFDIKKSVTDCFNSGFKWNNIIVVTWRALPGGQTAHSKFKILVSTFDDSICNIHQGSELAELLKVTKLIIWDEAPMAHKFCFEALDKSLRDIMGLGNESSTIFGGKVIVFGGDFRQMLPFIPRGS